MSDDFLIRRTGELLESPLDDDLVGLNVDQGACYGFNATAARVWRMLDRPRRLSELRRQLLDEYDVDPETCDGQVRALLAQLEENQLIAMEPLPA
jgi:hypothetical protein